MDSESRLTPEDFTYGRSKRSMDEDMFGAEAAEQVAALNEGMKLLASGDEAGYARWWARYRLNTHRE